MRCIQRKISDQTISLLKICILIFALILLLPEEAKTQITLIGGVQTEGEVWLTDIEIDGHASDLSRYPLSGKWKRLNSSIVYIPDQASKGNILELSFSNASNIKLTFNMHNWSGSVGIQDGDSYVEYNLHAESGQTEYIVQNLSKYERNIISELSSLIIFGLILMELKKIEDNLLISSAIASFPKRWGILILNVFVISIALGALSKNFYIELWLILMYILFYINHNRTSFHWFWISILISYLYRLYYLSHTYILHPTVIFSFLMGLVVFHSFQLGYKKNCGKWTAIIMVPLLGLGVLEIIGNPNIKNLIPQMLVVNIILITLYFLFWVNLIRYKKYGWYIALMSLLFISVANFYIVQFKKYALSPADLFQIGTALEVAGDYQYFLSDKIIWGILLTIIAITLIKNYIPEKSGTVRVFIQSKVIAFAALMLVSAWMRYIDFQTEYHIVWNDWDTTETYSQNGFAASFVTAWQRMQIDKPSEYSKHTAEEILSDYGMDFNQTFLNEKPVIIAIMNESFSDLNDLGSLGDTQDVMWFFNSLDCVEKGRTYVSVRGGGTCNSEFEFLTGNSLEFYNNIYPYTQFNFENVPTLVSELKAQGYKTIAMHPANPTNYGRQSVYQEMGFDEFYSFEDYAQYEKVFLDRTADIDDYKEILKVIEETDEPLFIFNVTIQNHGGYALSTLNHSYELVEVDESIEKYDDVRMYLTLMNESNKALQYLIDQLRNCSKSILLCMFGDHQPGVLSTEFEEELFEPASDQSELYNVERRYQTPYLIWSNYLPQGAQDDMLTSPNYLAAKLLEYAGLEVNPYFDFLLEMQSEIPACNAFGYFAKDEKWHDYSEKTEYTEWFKKYRILQYYNMFDDEID